MSDLENLIENTLVTMENDKLCFNDVRKRVQNDPNLRRTSLSADDVLVICQYIRHRYGVENAQYKEALIKEIQEDYNNRMQEKYKEEIFKGLYSAVYCDGVDDEFKSVIKIIENIPFARRNGK